MRCVCWRCVFVAALVEVAALRIDPAQAAKDADAAYQDALAALGDAAAAVERAAKVAKKADGFVMKLTDAAADAAAAVAKMVDGLREAAGAVKFAAGKADKAQKDADAAKGNVDISVYQELKDAHATAKDAFEKDQVRYDDMRKDVKYTVRTRIDTEKDLKDATIQSDAATAALGEAEAALKVAEEKVAAEKVAAAAAAAKAAAATVRASGDPHARNILGQKFEIYQTGRVGLFQIPRYVDSEKNTILHAVADIDRVSAVDCHSGYMRRIIVKTNLSLHEFAFDVGDVRNMSSPFTCKVGNSTAVVHTETFVVPVANEVNISGFFSPFIGGPHPEAGRKFASFSISIKGASLQIQRIVKPTLQLHYLNIEARNLAQLSDEVGGLLGVDDHSDQLVFKQNCTRSSQRQIAFGDDNVGSHFHASL